MYGRLADEGVAAVDCIRGCRILLRLCWAPNDEIIIYQLLISDRSSIQDFCLPAIGWTAEGERRVVERSTSVTVEAASIVLFPARDQLQALLLQDWIIFTKSWRRTIYSLASHTL